jgi:hypothetical protein
MNTGVLSKIRIQREEIGANLENQEKKSKQAY